MLPPAVTTTRLPRRDVEAVLVAQLGFERATRRGQAFDRPVAMIGQLAAEATPASAIASRGGP